MRSETLVDDESTVSTADTETCNVDVDDAQSCTAEHAQSDETLIIFDWDDNSAKHISYDLEKDRCRV